MGMTMCSSELLPENYPPTRRFLRKPYDQDVDHFDQLTSTMRASIIRNMVHVMSYNLLADELATPDYHTN